MKDYIKYIIFLVVLILIGVISINLYQNSQLEDNFKKTDATTNTKETTTMKEELTTNEQEKTTEEIKETTENTKETVSNNSNVTANNNKTATTTSDLNSSNVQNKESSSSNSSTSNNGSNNSIQSSASASTNKNSTSSNASTAFNSSTSQSDRSSEEIYVTIEVENNSSNSTSSNQNQASNSSNTTSFSTTNSKSSTVTSKNTNSINDYDVIEVEEKTSSTSNSTSNNKSQTSQSSASNNTQTSSSTNNQSSNSSSNSSSSKSNTTSSSSNASNSSSNSSSSKSNTTSSSSNASNSSSSTQNNTTNKANSTDINKNTTATTNTTTKILKDGDIVGATGYSALSSGLYLKKKMNSSAENIVEIKVGEPFRILAKNSEDTWWKVKYKGKVGYLQNAYCMINLPDYIPSITYSIDKANKTISTSSGYKLSTYGKKLYTQEKSYNKRLNRNEYIVPVVYSFAKKILTAQTRALAEGYSLKIYDAYRPVSVSKIELNSLQELYNSNSTVRNNINYSYDQKGNRQYWGTGWFLALNLSSHNLGAAIDVSLTKKGSTEDLKMPTAVSELSTKAIKYYTPVSGQTTVRTDLYASSMTSDAKKLDEIMVGANLTTLASEWWHFQDNDTYYRMKSYEPSGLNFQPTTIVSN